MNSIIIQEDVKLIEERLKKFEDNTGCELLLVVANSSDPYPAAPLRFGIVGAFLFNLVFVYYFQFQHHYFYPVSFLVAVLLFTYIGKTSFCKRLALSDWEVLRETMEKAIECFHTLGTTKVSHKTTAMIFVSVLEKKIHVLIDEKLKEKIDSSELTELVEIMQTHFKQKNTGLGFIQSIDALEKKILLDFGGKITNLGSSELKDTIHFI